MTWTTIAATERGLPPIWSGGFRPERIDFYTKLTIAHGGVRGGREVIAEFVAAMLLESSLDNLIIGNNAKNGSDNVWLGIGWCQLDTGYHATSLEQVHALRSDPNLSLTYITGNKDLVYQGPTRTWFNTKRWHAWKHEKIDPPEGTWSPLKACLDAYDRATA